MTLKWFSNTDTWAVITLTDKHEVANTDRRLSLYESRNTYKIYKIYRYKEVLTTANESAHVTTHLRTYSTATQRDVDWWRRTASHNDNPNAVVQNTGVSTRSPHIPERPTSYDRRVVEQYEQGDYSGLQRGTTSALPPRSDERNHTATPTHGTRKLRDNDSPEHRPTGTPPLDWYDKPHNSRISTSGKRWLSPQYNRISTQSTKHSELCSNGYQIKYVATLSRKP